MFHVKAFSSKLDFPFARQIIIQMPEDLLWSQSLIYTGSFIAAACTCAAGGAPWER